jgi:hypothetical protein
VELDAVVTGIATEVESSSAASAIFIEAPKATRHVTMIELSPRHLNPHHTTFFPEEGAAATSAEVIVTVKRVVLIRVGSAASTEGRKCTSVVTNLNPPHPITFSRMEGAAGTSARLIVTVELVGLILVVNAANTPERKCTSVVTNRKTMVDVT